MYQVISKPPSWVKHRKEEVILECDTAEEAALAAYTRQRIGNSEVYVRNKENNQEYISTFSYGQDYVPRYGLCKR